jgi:hypothetical protein
VGEAGIWPMACFGEPSPTTVDMLSLGKRVGPLPFEVLLLILKRIDSMRSSRASWLWSYKCTYRHPVASRHGLGVVSGR